MSEPISEKMLPADKDLAKIFNVVDLNNYQHVSMLLGNPKKVDIAFKKLKDPVRDITQ